MKILLLGDASNYHAALAHGLRSLGHSVTLASAGSAWMDTSRDIDISRRGTSLLSGAVLFARMLALAETRLKGFDVVQLVSPTFAELRPARLERILRSLRRGNGAVWLTALGTDSNYVAALTGANPPLRYSEWHGRDGLRPWAHSPQAKMEQWLAPELADYTEALYGSVDGIVTALYEYHAVLAHTHPQLRTVYGGIPVALDLLPQPAERIAGEPLAMLYAAHKGREGEKGSLQLLEILEAACREFPGRVRLLKPQNMPYARFLEVLAESDIVADQIYSFTPATTALLSMAMGAAVLSGGEPEYYRFIGEDTLRPVLNVIPDNPEANYGILRKMISEPEALRQVRQQGQEFVERHNSASVVARRFLEAWLNG